MKPLCYLQIFLVSILFTACTGANFYLKQGNYDAAVNYAIQKLRKNPRKADKDILALEQAWKIEQAKILDRIEDLKLEGSPDAWVEIHARYAEIDAYQKAITPVLPLFIKKEFRNADINIINVKQELVDAKLKAANFMYAKGMDLLAKNDKFAAREAFAHFQKVRDYYGTFKDVDEKIEESYNKGQNHILIAYRNNTQLIIPQQFMNNLGQYDEAQLNGVWTKYYKDPAARASFDYLIEVHILNVNIGPEQVNNTSYVDRQEVEEGFQYVMDANGNVAKDSLGNDIKEPAYVSIAASVYRTEQTKVGILNGVVEFKRGNGSVFQNFPFQENLVFRNNFATFQGNPKALSKASKAIIGGEGIPFSSDLQMVMDASEIIKNKSFSLILNNNGLVMN